MSLSRPHPMITWATTSYRVNKLVTEMRMISGRFCIGSLLRHFYPNICGVCELCGEEVEDLPHILLPKCPRLAKQADKHFVFAKEFLKALVKASKKFYEIMFKHCWTRQFLLISLPRHKLNLNYLILG